MAEDKNGYPGEAASVEDLQKLAAEYHKAAQTLLALGKPKEPLTRAPFRLAAIHAIELYLNVLLRHLGKPPEEIRALKHDMKQRADLAIAGGLRLRARTAEHLLALSANREYLVSRYAPELTATGSQVNRLTATLEEVAKKVPEMISSANGKKQKSA